MHHFDDDDFDAAFLVSNNDIVDPPSPVVVGDVTSTLRIKMLLETLMMVRLALSRFRKQTASCCHSVRQSTPRCGNQEPPQVSFSSSQCETRRDEPVAKDAACSNAPAIDGGETCAQIFVGFETLATDVCRVKNEKKLSKHLRTTLQNVVQWLASQVTAHEWREAFELRGFCAHCTSDSGKVSCTSSIRTHADAVVRP